MNKSEEEKMTLLDKIKRKNEEEKQLKESVKKDRTKKMILYESQLVLERDG